MSKQMTELQKRFMARKPRYEAFCQAVGHGLQPHRAYLTAFDHKEGKPQQLVSRSVKRLLEREDIQTRLHEIQLEQLQKEQADQRELAERTKISKEFILLGLRETLERSLQRKPVLDYKGNPTGEWMFDGRTANRALELLGKEIGMFKDQLEIGRPGEFERLSRMTPEELEAEEKAAWDQYHAAKEAETAITRASLPGIATRVKDEGDGGE